MVSRRRRNEPAGWIDRNPGTSASSASSVFTIVSAWPSRIRFVDTAASGRIHYTAIFRHFETAEFEFMRSEVNPQFANIATPNARSKDTFRMC